MEYWRQAKLAFLVAVLFTASTLTAYADARFDLTGPRIDVRVTRGDRSLDIAQVPNLQPGDKLWLHPDLPPTQSVHYLLICVFLRGTTNPPPDTWFTRIETWDKHVREEGVFVTVPDEAQQALLLLAPETGGDFSTLKSAVRGRPGIFVRAQQDLVEAGFEQARIDKYLASIRRVPPTDTADLQKHSDMLSRTLNLRSNDDCFKRPVDTQFTCLTQSGSQLLLDDGHGATIAQRISNGNSSDFLNQASYTQAAGGGLYSAYVGAVVDLVRLLSNVHSAQFQYIPAVASPQGQEMNLKLNTPPSFHSPKSVIVIGLPAISKAIPPPLRPSDANHVTCLLKPNVTIPIEGAPLVFSTAFAHHLVLHLLTSPGAPAEADIPIVPDAYQGGLVLQQIPEHHRELPMPSQVSLTARLAQPGAPQSAVAAASAPATPTAPKPVQLKGVIQGMWGFDPFVGPTVELQQLPGAEWHEVGNSGNSLIAGHSATLILTSTGTSCVHTITALAADNPEPFPLDFASKGPDADTPQLPANLEVKLPSDKTVAPGDLSLRIQQYGQPKPDSLSAHTYSEPADISDLELHAGDKSLLLTGTQLASITKITIGDLTFRPQPQSPAADNTLRLTLPDEAPNPPTRIDDHLEASISLNDGRTFQKPVVVTAPRPQISILSKSADPAQDPIITLGSPDDLSLASRLTFTLKSASTFPRSGQLEIETLDSTLHATLTLAPSGGLLLQDPHTVVATLDPSRSFGPSAFGTLHLRVSYPAPHHKGDSDKDLPPLTSDWIPLVTLVRLPILSGLQCPTELSLPCTLTGTNLFLISAISATSDFENPTPVPDGFTGTTITVPHPAGSAIYLKLRDNPEPIDTATPPITVLGPAKPHNGVHPASKQPPAPAPRS
ncbi:MAG: hypothetical protein PW735_01975 [Acidobacteriaceae bacterium]|nr:hypothetical protein [Acidobacteriaceae bacterium]